MQIDTSKATGAIGNIFSAVQGIILGQSSYAWSRKWIVVVGLGLVAWKLPGFVMPSWLSNIVMVWLGGQSVVDAAEHFVAAKTPVEPKKL